MQTDRQVQCVCSGLCVGYSLCVSVCVCVRSCWMKLWPSRDLQEATSASQWTSTPSTTGGSIYPGPGTTSPGTGTPDPGQEPNQSNSCPIYVTGPVPVYVLVLSIVVVLSMVLVLVPVFFWLCLQWQSCIRPWSLSLSESLSFSRPKAPGTLQVRHCDWSS